METKFLTTLGAFGLVTAAMAVGASKAYAPQEPSCENCYVSRDTLHLQPVIFEGHLEHAMLAVVVDGVVETVDVSAEFGSLEDGKTYEMDMRFRNSPERAHLSFYDTGNENDGSFELRVE